jgi:DNA polymerase-4
VTGRALEEFGIRTIAQVRQISLSILQQRFGKSGEHLWQLAHGIDDRRVIPDREAKSISHETTFAEDLDDREALRAWVMELAEQVGWRLRRHELRGRTVQIKLRFADFQTITRARTIPQATDISGEISRVAAELLEICLDQFAQRIRLVGVGVSGLEEGRLLQQSLFVDEEREKQSQLDRAADLIREKFGSAALHRGSGLLHEAKHKPMPRPERNDSDAS